MIDFAKRWLKWSWETFKYVSVDYVCSYLGHLPRDIEQFPQSKYGFIIWRCARCNEKFLTMVHGSGDGKVPPGGRIDLTPEKEIALRFLIAERDAAVDAVKKPNGKPGPNDHILRLLGEFDGTEA